MIIHLIVGLIKKIFLYKNYFILRVFLHLIATVKTK